MGVKVADTLVEKDHFDADKIGKRAENITGRREDNRQRALDQHEKLKNQVKLHEFLQDLEELAEWVQEKYATSQDESYRSAKTIHSKWTRHQAFEAEIAANKERLFEAEKSAQELSKEKPEFKDVIEPKLKELAKQFDDLEVHTKEKGAMLFDANREVLVQQTCDDIDSYITDLEKQIVSGDTANDLTSVNILMQKQQVIQTQMAVKARQVEEIDKQTEYLQKTVPEEKIEPIVVKKTAVLERFEKIKAPLLERQKALEKKKEAFQFCRDVEDEKLWIDEKLPVANSPDYGNSLFNVHVLKKKNQSLATEIDNHEPRINAICNNGRKLIDEGHEDAKKFEALISDLTQKWQELKDAIENLLALEEGRLLARLQLLLQLVLQLVVVDLQVRHDAVHHLDANEHGQDLFARLHRRLRVVQRRQQAHPHQRRQDGPDLRLRVAGQQGDVQVLHGAEDARRHIVHLHRHRVPVPVPTCCSRQSSFPLLGFPALLAWPASFPCCECRHGSALISASGGWWRRIRYRLLLRKYF